MSQPNGQARIPFTDFFPEFAGHGETSEQVLNGLLLKETLSQQRQIRMLFAQVSELKKENEKLYEWVLGLGGKIKELQKKARK